jgi:hypothetical protein
VISTKRDGIDDLVQRFNGTLVFANRIVLLSIEWARQERELSE